MSAAPLESREAPLAIVQARMTSSRLPGKVMLDLSGKPMILQQLDRVRRSQGISGIVIATSSDPSDDPLADLLTREGFDVVRGSLDDVLARFVQVIESRLPANIARVTADCPLISPTVIDQVIERFQETDADYCSNTLVPTYPDGLDVEVVRAEVLMEVDRETSDADEREHVTLGVYRRPERFHLENYVDPTGVDHSNLRWTVDSAEDFDFVAWVFDSLHRENPEFDYQDVRDLIRRFPQRSRTSDDSARNQAIRGLDTGAMVLGEDS